MVFDLRVRGRRGSTNIVLLTSILAFYALLLIGSNIFNLTVTESGSFRNLKPDGSTVQDESLLDTIFNFADSVPIVNIFVPLLRIMTFQFADVPVNVVVMLDLIVILSGVALLSMVLGN